MNPSKHLVICLLSLLLNVISKINGQTDTRLTQTDTFEINF